MVEPYYDQDGITIYNADCREVLPQLGTFDLLLTDPPYGIGAKWDKPKGFGTCGGKLWNGDAGWDNETSEDNIKTAIEMCSMGAVVWGGNYYNLPPSRGYFIWDKMQSGFSLADSEYAWCSEPVTPKTFRYARAQLASEGKMHPTQKPLNLMRWCLSFFKKATTVLDPFMGSGTTLEAARLEGRQAVGIEINEKYCEAAVNRLAQGVLF